MPGSIVEKIHRRSSLWFTALSRALLTRVAVCNIRGLRVRVGVSSELEQFRVNTYAFKEPETLDWLDSSLREADVFIDVGANIGLYSLYAAALQPTSMVYAIEPESQNFARLCSNIALNGFRNIVPCNFALADEDTFGYFHVDDLRAGSSLHTFGKSSQPASRHVVNQGCISLTLDGAVSRRWLPQPSLLKIDVDGLEPKILKGAPVVLASDKLRTILIELNVKDQEQISNSQQELQNLGYQLVRRSDWIWEQDGWQARNYIFERRI